MRGGIGMLKRRLVITLLAGFTLGTAIGVASAGSADAPPWDNPDGTLDLSELPAFLPALDCTGAVVGQRANPLHPNNETPYTPPVPPGASCDPIIDEGISYVPPPPEEDGHTHP